MKRVVIVNLILFLSTFVSFTQVNDTTSDWRSDFWSKVFTGGNLGMQFGSYTFIDVSPQIGYRFTKKIHAGVGVTYRYLSDNINHYSTSIYGGCVFSRYYFLNNLFAHGEYEILSGEWVYGKRFNVTSIFVGGGYSQHIGGRVAANILILWNINESIYSPYRNPIFRAGVGIGL